MNSITKKIVVAVSVAVLGTIGAVGPANAAAGMRTQGHVWCC